MRGLESTVVGRFCHSLMGSAACMLKPCGLSEELLHMKAVGIKVEAGKDRAEVDTLAPLT